MAYRCTKYNKILVGPKKTCESCEIGDLESKCEHRVWQDGVLKEGGRRTRGIIREIWPYGYDGRGFRYSLGDDGNYHLTQIDDTRAPMDLTTRVRSNVDIPKIPILTPEEMQLCKKNRRYYLALVEHKRPSLGSPTS
jgi:hypothetical protein